jgi:hypothetical protein
MDDWSRTVARDCGLGALRFSARAVAVAVAAAVEV